MTWMDYQYIRIILSCCILGVGAFQDLKMRGVYNWVWMIGALMAVGFWCYDGFVGHLGIDWFMQYIISVPAVTILSFVLYRKRILARADMYGLIVASMLAGEIGLSHSMLSPITVVENSLLIAGIVFPVNATINGINVLRGKKIFDGYQLTQRQKVIAFFVGHRVNKPWFGFSMVKQTETGKTLRFSLFHEEDDNYCKENDVWVSPSIPFMLFLLLAYITQIFFGDIILKFMFTVI